MAIKVKAVERNLNFGQTETDKYAYVMTAETYSTLSSSKVITEASIRSGLPKATINSAWGAIAEVLEAWLTEGHSVAIPSVGTMRFGVRSKAVSDVNAVKTSLITSRRVLFTPSTNIKQELANTSIEITCYDRTGKTVKRVNAATKDVDDSTDDTGGDNTGSTEQGGSSSTEQGGTGSTEQGGSGSTDTGSGDGSLV